MVNILSNILEFKIKNSFWHYLIFFSIPENLIDGVDSLKMCKIAKFKDDVIAYLTGTDTCSKLTIMNYRLNQVNLFFSFMLEVIFEMNLYIYIFFFQFKIVYQTKNMKLLNSFSFNSIQPVVAIANEQKLTIINLINQSWVYFDIFNIFL